MAASAPANRKMAISIFGLEMPVASAATSASRTAISARPNRLRATFALIQVVTAAKPMQRK